RIIIQSTIYRFTIQVTFYPISGKEYAQTLTQQTEHDFSFNFLFKRYELKNPSENIKEKLKRIKTNILRFFSEKERILYNLNGGPFVEIKEILIEIFVPVNGNSNLIKRSWNIEYPNLFKSFTFFVGAFNGNLFLRARIHLFNEKENEPSFFNKEDDEVFIKSSNEEIILEKFKLKNLTKNNKINNLIIFPKWKNKYSTWHYSLFSERKKRTTLLLEIPIKKIKNNINNIEEDEEEEKGNINLLNLYNKIIISIEKEKVQKYILYEKGETSKINNVIKNNEQQLEDIEEELECSICKENINKNSLIIGRKCNHIYHKECIYKWFEEESNKPKICPICQQYYFNIEIPIEEPVYSNKYFNYEYQILLDPLPYTDMNDNDYFINKQIKIVDNKILGYILANSLYKYPKLSKIKELGFARSKLSTFDVDDLNETFKKFKKH
ncbi:hypothetical protein Mgra_00001550, partial [Meloidogyne graminicola]